MRFNYKYRGMVFHTLIAIDKYFCLRDGGASRLLEKGEIEVIKVKL
jgi:hypothetical protein